jgi:uncharacterized membrane-anchored protein YitT (DUF2179 family)
MSAGASSFTACMAWPPCRFAIDLIGFTLPIQEPILAVLAGGVLMGAGTGIILHSLGSAGGMDIVAIILNQKFNVRMGTFYLPSTLCCSCLQFRLSGCRPGALLPVHEFHFTSQTLDYVLTIFNQRKMVIIISDANDRIAKEIHTRLSRGVTFLDGSGAYTGRAKKIILTVIHNYQLKRLEEAVMSIDPEAFVITESTFNVLGRGFSRRKVY